jgi:methylated-DNA-protein-cysteine methyltransferase-like protein
MSNTFRHRVLHITRAIPEGKVLAYGEIATLAGSPRAARAVGNIMQSLGPDETDVPWHRVINRMLSISQRGSVARATLQRARLEAEGVRFDRDGIIDEAHRFDTLDAPRFLDEPLAPWEPPSDWEDGD